MKRFMFGVIVFAVVFTAGVSYAQDAPQMPDKVRGFLDSLVGTWKAEGDFWNGISEYRWNASKSAVTVTRRMTAGEGTTLLCWDGESEDGIAKSWAGIRPFGLIHGEEYGKVLSDGGYEGKQTAMIVGEKATATVKISFQGPNQFTETATEMKYKGERDSDRTTVYTRVKGVTRTDFEEFCKLQAGSWVGEVQVRQDVPGVGQKGDIVTAHTDYIRVEDGYALIGKSYWPAGTNTEIIAYDEANKQIKSIGISPVFGIDSPTFHYSHGKWISKGAFTTLDGTKTYFNATGIFGDNGKTLTVTVINTTGREKTEFKDVWHRMNK
jgi:hypothetical protein